MARGRKVSDLRTDPIVEPQKIVRRKLSDEVFDRLLEAIESGQYKPGSQIPSERELMVAYGVGRPAIREAMQALEQLGLLVITHGERARVIEPTAFDVIAQIDRAARHLLTTSPQSFEQLKEAREFFEAGMAAEAARRAGPEDIARLEAALARHQSLLKANPKDFIAADMAFHTAIAAVTGNAVFEAVSRAMLQWLSTFHSGSLRWKGHERTTLAEHRQILDAIAAHDPDAAATAMRDHLRRTRAVYSTRRKRAAGAGRAKGADGG
jgi:GntR family transcriptional regulator, sialic acid-inducible nan operon repressor